MCYYFPQFGYCYPSYAYNCYPGYSGYPGYPNYPSYYYQTTTTVTYSGYSSYVGTAGSIPESRIALISTGGTTVHDAWLTITPLQSGEYAVVLSAQGLQPSGTYMIEGASVGTHVNIGPLSGFAAGSEFVADNQGNGIYSSIFTMNPSGTYTTVLLLYLPNGQMEGSVLVATASLG